MEETSGAIEGSRSKRFRLLQLGFGLVLFAGCTTSRAPGVETALERMARLKGSRAR